MHHHQSTTLIKIKPSLYVCVYMWVFNHMRKRNIVIPLSVSLFFATCPDFMVVWSLKLVF